MSLNQKENNLDSVLGFNYKNTSKRNTIIPQTQDKIQLNEMESSDIFFSDKPFFRPITNQK